MSAKYVAIWPRTRQSGFRLMGFGHRVYKNYDPRAKIIKKPLAISCWPNSRLRTPFSRSLRQLEEVALNDPYFVERKLYPNVDFYSGVIYRAIGIPQQMFTVLFAMGRLPGWIAHWKPKCISRQQNESVGHGKSTQGPLCGIRKKPEPR